MAPKYSNSLFTNAKDYAIIVFGLALYAIGFTAFILPHDVIMGGLPGVGTLVLLATEKMFGVGNGIPVSVTQYICNIILLIIAFRIVGKTFVLRTVISTSILSLFIGMLEFYFRSNPPLISEISLSVALGGILCVRYGYGYDFYSQWFDRWYGYRGCNGVEIEQRKYRSYNYLCRYDDYLVVNLVAIRW